jgi:two-component system, NarL family, nitrate/nitrite response regulator NarL
VTGPRTAVLADAKPALRAGLAIALRGEEIHIVAEVACAADAIAATVGALPDVCIVDVDLPGGALNAIALIGEGAPATAVVALGPKDEEVLLAAIRAGAAGYLPRDTSARGLARAISAVFDGSAAMPRMGIEVLVQAVRGRSGPWRSAGRPGASLTAREVSAVDLLRRGLDTNEIARELAISPVTVRRHVTAAARKLGAGGSAGLRRSAGTP